MSDEWKLQHKHNVTGEWVEVSPSTMSHYASLVGPDRLRWVHSDGRTQFVRVTPSGSVAPPMAASNEAEGTAGAWVLEVFSMSYQACGKEPWVLDNDNAIGAEPWCPAERLRWRDEGTEQTQPARTDDEGRLLPPRAVVDCDTCGGAGFTHEKQGEIDGSPVLYAKRCPNGCKVEPGEVPSVLNSVGPRGALVRMKGRQIGQTEKMRKAIEAHKGSHAFVTLDEYSVYQQFADVGMLPSIDPAEAAIEQRRESFRRYADVQLAGLICPHMPGEGDLSVNHYTRHGRSLCYQMTRDCPWCGHAERRVYESDVDDMSAHERNRVMDGVGRARERILDALGDCRDAVPELDQVDDDCEHIYTPMAYGEGPTCIRCGGHEPVDSPVSQRVAEEIRTQLVDGLPGEWEAIEGSRHDWVMGAGPHFRAFVVVQCDQPCAVGLVEMRDPYGNWNEVPGTRLRTSATDATDGDDYIMRCAQKLAPKVEAVRAMVEALRGDG